MNNIAAWILMCAVVGMLMSARARRFRDMDRAGGRKPLLKGNLPLKPDRRLNKDIRRMRSGQTEEGQDSLRAESRGQAVPGPGAGGPSYEREASLFSRSAASDVRESRKALVGMEDREHDWLAQQLREEAQAGRRLQSDMLSLKREHLPEHGKK